MSACNAGRGDKPRTTLRNLQKYLFGIPIIYQEVMGMPDMPKDNIPDEVLKKVAGTSKCADDKPQDDCCEEDDD